MKKIQTLLCPQSDLLAPPKGASNVCRAAPLYSLLAVALFLPGISNAEETGELDKFKIDLGSFFITDISTVVSLAATSGPVGVGARIDFEDQLGLENREAVPRIDGYYRFNKHHRVDFSYWKIDREATRTVAEEISIGDITIPANATVQTHFDSDTFKLAYGYSPYNVPKVELGLIVGLHVTSIDLAVTDVSGAAGSEQADAPVPLPVVGFYLRYHIGSKWRFIANNQWFALSYGDYDGSLTDLRVAIEHHTFKNAGFGFGFNRIAFDLEVDSGDLRGMANSTNTGFQLYVFGTFGKVD